MSDRYTRSVLGSSRTLAAPGVRTPPRPGWRTGVGSAFAVALADPALWLLGAVGFACRGGILLLALVVLVLPTPIEVRQLLGGYLGSSGLTPEFYSLLVPVALAGGFVVAAALLLVARVELAAWERFHADADADEAAEGALPAEPIDVASSRPTSTGRWQLLSKLCVVEVVAAAALAAAAVPLALGVYETTVEEIVRPTPGGVALYLRVLYAVREPLLLLLLAVILIDIFTATASRRLMIERGGGGRGRSGWRTSLPTAAGLLAAPFRKPLGTIGTSVVAWLTTLGVLAPVAWALDAAWDATRAAYLGLRATPDPPQIAWLVIVSLVFAGIWAAAVLLAGFASAVRSGLWSAECLRAADQ